MALVVLGGRQGAQGERRAMGIQDDNTATREAQPLAAASSKVNLTRDEAPMLALL